MNPIDASTSLHVGPELAQPAAQELQAKARIALQQTYPWSGVIASARVTAAPRRGLHGFVLAVKAHGRHDAFCVRPAIAQPLADTAFYVPQDTLYWQCPTATHLLLPSSCWPKIRTLQGWTSRPAAEQASTAAQ